MIQFFRRFSQPKPPDGGDRQASPPPTISDSDDRLRQLEERVAEMDRHRWELQHRINVLRDDFDRVLAANADAARGACQAELEIFRRDFEPALKDIYGELGANFRRIRLSAAADSLSERFGEAERKRREGGAAEH
jgi:hypothetical protein